jgi:Uma2 family endonuclease
MILSPPAQGFATDKAGNILYPVDNGEPLSNDTEHLRWITFVKNGLEDWFGDRDDVFVAADLLWYPVEGRPDISRAPDVMVVLDHPAGERSSYRQWQEAGRPPQVVFEFLSASNTAAEMLGKLDFYSDHGCQEFYIYDYQRGTFRAHDRAANPNALTKCEPSDDNTWFSPLLDMTFGLSESGKLWIRRPDGKLLETQREISLRAKELEQQAENLRQRAEAERQRAETERRKADLLAARLREMGVDPDSIG